MYWGLEFVDWGLGSRGWGLRVGVLGLGSRAWGAPPPVRDSPQNAAEVGARANITPESSWRCSRMLPWTRS